MKKNLTSWLFRTYLNLDSPPDEAPFHNFGADFAAEELFANREYPRIQAVIMPSFREELAKASDMQHAYTLFLQSLPKNSNHSRWKRLQEFVVQYPKLPHTQRALVLRVLCKLCLYDEVQRLESGSLVRMQVDDAEIQYHYILSHYAKMLDGKKHAYALKQFEILRELAPIGSLARLNATYQLVVQNVKHLYDVQAVDYWQVKHKMELESIKDKVDPFVFTQMLARFYRVGGFVQQMNNDSAEVVHQMDKAEQHARELFNWTSEESRLQHIYDICAKEILYPVLESRTKEALWLKDLGLAHKRVERLCELAPYDCRAYLQLGEVLVELNEIEEALEAYRKAAFLAPPGEEVAYFMMGQCYQRMGKDVDAHFDYMKALELDPQGISSREELKKLCEYQQSCLSKLTLNWISANYSDSDYAAAANTVKPYQVQQLNEQAVSSSPSAVDGG